MLDIVWVIREVQKHERVSTEKRKMIQQARPGPISMWSRRGSVVDWLVIGQRSNLMQSSGCTWELASEGSGSR